MKQIYFFLSVLLITALSISANAQSGALDLSFLPGNGPNSPIYTIAIQNNGKIIIAGDFTTYNGIPRVGIARLDADGTLDATFNPGTGVTNGVVKTALMQGDKIIISGTFTAYNGTARIYIARLNADGTLDATFDPGTGTNYSILTTAIQSDGKIIIGGDFTTFNNTPKYRIARLNDNGTLDDTFVTLLGAQNGTVNTIAVQSDGKIIIGGGFTAYDGATRQRIARLHVNGALDTTFDPGAASIGGYVYTTAIQSDGKIIVGGDFTAFNGTQRKNIARLNANGTIDATFNPGTGAIGGDIRTMLIQNNGTIIIGGYFDSYNGTAKNKIACLNTDGTLDGAFNQITGANSYYVYTSALQSDGKIIIGGNFTEFNGTARKNIARITGTTPSAVSLIQESTTSIYPNPVSSQLKIEMNDCQQKTNLVISSVTGQVVYKSNFDSETTVDTSNFTSGTYVVKLQNSKKTETIKIIKE